MGNDVVVRGSVRARFEVTLTLDGQPFDLTGATVVFLYRKPGGAGGSWAAAVADPAAGTARFVTPDAATLDSVGRWELQPRVATAAGEVLYGQAVTFLVAESLE